MASADGTGAAAWFNDPNTPAVRVLPSWLLPPSKAITQATFAAYFEIRCLTVDAARRACDCAGRGASFSRFMLHALGMLRLFNTPYY